jgi:cyanophycinase
MKFNYNFLLVLHLFIYLGTSAQKSLAPKGNLFIIGGGSRSSSLMQSMITTTVLTKDDYIVVLPMSGEEPDSSFFYIAADLRKVCDNSITNLNFTTEKINDKAWLDSLQRAKLIFITGGDQNRFMKVVLHTPIHEAIKEAYQRGSTIAGTSAGAAVMSEQMITGNEITGDTTKPGSFRAIRYQMVEIKQGLGLVKSAVIDQHFVARSRYNRLLSVLAEFPRLLCIGIDEGTAIMIKNKRAVVYGDGQVITFSLANSSHHKQNEMLVSLKAVSMRILLKNEIFYLK